MKKSFRTCDGCLFTTAPDEPLKVWSPDNIITSWFPGDKYDAATSFAVFLTGLVDEIDGTDEDTITLLVVDTTTGEEVLT